MSIIEFSPKFQLALAKLDKCGIRFYLVYIALNTSWSHENAPIWLAKMGSIEHPTYYDGDPVFGKTPFEVIGRLLGNHISNPKLVAGSTAKAITDFLEILDEEEKLQQLSENNKEQ